MELLHLCLILVIPVWLNANADTICERVIPVWLNANADTICERENIQDKWLEEKHHQCLTDCFLHHLESWNSTEENKTSDVVINILENYINISGVKFNFNWRSESLIDIETNNPNRTIEYGKDISIELESGASMTAVYKNFANHLKAKYRTDNTSLTFPLITDIITVVIADHEQYWVNVTFKHHDDTSDYSAICVRWKNEHNLFSWSKEDCKMVDSKEARTQCSCTCTKSITMSIIGSIKGFENVVENLNSLSKSKNKNADLLQMQNSTLTLARNAVNKGPLKISSEKIEIIVQSVKGNYEPKKIAEFSTFKNYIKISWGDIVGDNAADVAAIGIIALKASEENDTSSWAPVNEAKLKLKSDVLTIITSNKNTDHLTMPITLLFENNKVKSLMEIPNCMYLLRGPNGSMWDDKGCQVVKSNDTFTHCSCNHLTSFAVLMSLAPIEPQHEKNLEMITFVGVGISLFCLLLSISIFGLCKSIQGTRTTIHTHLCITLLLAEVLLLVIDAEFFKEKICQITAILLHYLFLTSFAWMMLEGVQLYLMVVKVFQSKILQSRILFSFGYGLSLLIVAITVATNHNAYGANNICWLSIENGFIWAFVGPVCAVVGLNLIFFSITMWKLIDKFSILSMDVSHFTKVRRFLCTAIAQLVVLGLTWILGFMHFNDQTIVMSYLFTIFNSFQGLFIFILHCVLNKQVRKTLYNYFNLKNASQVTSKKSSLESHTEKLSAE